MADSIATGDGVSPALTTIDVRGVTSIGELMVRIRDTSGGSTRDIEAATGIDKASVNAWINDAEKPDSPRRRASPPGALRCWRIADYLAGGQHDVDTWLWVMKLAGHMPDDIDVPTPAEFTVPEGLPGWVRLVPRLSPADSLLVERMVESLARSPLVPA